MQYIFTNSVTEEILRSAFTVYDVFLRGYGHISVFFLSKIFNFFYSKTHIPLYFWKKKIHLLDRFLLVIIKLLFTLSNNRTILQPHD